MGCEPWLQFSALLTGSLFGTPIGAMLFGLSPTLPLGVDAASFAIAAALVFWMRGPFRQRTKIVTNRPMSWRHDICVSVRWLLQNSVLKRLLLLSGAINVTLGGVMAILVLYTRESLRLSSLGYGLLSAVFAVGGLIGAAVSPYLNSWIKPSLVFRLGILGAGLAGIGIGVAPTALVAYLFTLAFGAVVVAWDLAVVSFQQSVVPDQLMGRVSMAYQMVAVGAAALGAPIAGMITQAMGPRAPIVAGATLLLLAGCLVNTRPADTARSCLDGCGTRRACPQP